MTNPLDKFYTKDSAARRFIGIVMCELDLNSFDNIIEPSAGNGALLKYLPENTIALDLMPESENIIKQDFFDYEFPHGNNLVVMNPPFGRNSSLAIDFFNKAARNCSAIACIIPASWEKKSIHSRLDKDFKLIYNERMPAKSFTEFGEEKEIKCTQQIWVKNTTRPDLSEITNDHKNPWFYFTDGDNFDFGVTKTFPKYLNKNQTKIFKHPTFKIKQKVSGVKSFFRNCGINRDVVRNTLPSVGIASVSKSCIVNIYINLMDSYKLKHPDFDMWENKNRNDWDIAISGRLYYQMSLEKATSQNQIDTESNKDWPWIFIKFKSKESEEFFTNFKPSESLMRSVQGYGYREVTQKDIMRQYIFHR